MGASTLQTLEQSWGLGTLYSLRGTRAFCPQITIIALNAQSARNLNLPTQPDRWPRALHAELIERLQTNGTELIAFDLLFDRPREATDDAALARAIAQSGKVMLVAYLQRETQKMSGFSASVDTLVHPLPMFANAALASAPFALVKSNQGILEYLRFAPEGDDTASLPVVMAAHLQGPNNTALKRSERFTKFNLYGPPGHIPTLPYDQALALLRKGGAESAVFRHAVVLIGAAETNQPQQRDAYRTAWSTEQEIDLGGVELAATALCNELEQSALWKLKKIQELTLSILLLMGMLTPWRFFSARRALFFSTILALSYACLASVLFSKMHLWLPLAVPVFLAWPASIMLGLSMRLQCAHRQRQRLQTALARYGPKDEITRLAHQLNPTDHTVHVACLCTDMQGYTSRIENMPPAQAQAWLNHYFEIVFPIVRKHGGHVVDHAGDAMVCIWLGGKNAQTACQAATCCALALHQQLNHNHSTYLTRVGLHFGPVALGDVGDAQHAQQRVVGDIVNTANRIQAANKALGTKVLISDALMQHLNSAPGRWLGHFLLKGKTQAIGLYTPGLCEEQTNRRYTQALQAFEQGHDEQAKNHLTALLKNKPQDGPALFFLKHLTCHVTPYDHTLGLNVKQPRALSLE